MGYYPINPFNFSSLGGANLDKHPVYIDILGSYPVNLNWSVCCLTISFPGLFLGPAWAVIVYPGNYFKSNISMVLNLSCGIVVLWKLLLEVMFP